MRYTKAAGSPGHVAREAFDSSRTISLKPPIMSASAIENTCSLNAYTTDSLPNMTEAERIYANLAGFSNTNTRSTPRSG